MLVVAFLLGLLLGLAVMRLQMQSLLRQAETGEEEAMKLLDESIALMERVMEP